MNCLECAARDRREVPAVATCRDCGAAVCVEHIWVQHRTGRPVGTAGPARSVTRILRCGFCATGHPTMRPATNPTVLTAQPCGDPTCLC